ncbi:MAG: YicC family protein [Chlamydiia bacterium]|nr:YicC family protein [Chlamydiia bacterium]
MARSMTAYGRSHLKTDWGHFLIEIHSVNRKNLDIHSNLPKEMLALDMGLRKRVAEKVKRGNVTIRITKDSGSGAAAEMPSHEALKEVHQQWVESAQLLGYEGKEAVPFASLMQFVMTSPPLAQKMDEHFESELMHGMDEAIQAFIAMKETEGEALKQDIFPRLEMIVGKIKSIEGLVKEAPKRFHERLAKKLEELQIDHEGDEDRLTRELVIFADKVDVTEEITRLCSHVDQFHAILSGKSQRIGRELDFLTQEMNREVNTIASKSQELEITQGILAVKSELEKIREQLQNIE